MSNKYMLYMDEARPQPTPRFFTFSVQAAIAGRKDDIEDLKSQITHFDREVKWAESGRSQDVINAFAKLLHFVKANRLKLTFSYAVCSEIPTILQTHVDGLAKALIAEDTIRQLNCEQEPSRLDISIDGSLHSVLRHASRRHIIAYSKATNDHVITRIFGNETPNSRMKYMTDHLAGAFGQALERAYSPNVELTHTTKPELNRKRKRITDWVIEHLFPELKHSGKDGQDALENNVLIPRSEKAKASSPSWQELPPRRVFKITPSLFPRAN